MKQILLFALGLFLFTTLLRQYNPEIYDENGQYIKEIRTVKYQDNLLEFGFYNQNKDFYPRVTLEGLSVFNSGFGVWGFTQYTKPVIKEKWRELGYNLGKDFSSYSLSLSLALSYDFFGDLISKTKVFAGVNFQTGKSVLGPTAGVYLNEGKWSLKAYGSYSLLSAYKDSYSKETLAEYERLYGAYGYEEEDLIYIKGFDPSSWYRLNLSYQVNNDLNLGIISERFYGTGLFSEYSLKFKSRNLKDFRLKSIIGQNFEFNFVVCYLGVIMYL
ncbi:hypothetical protein K9M50_03255 [Patescibacteria group bacterium]|nr:hypothetical protein [Patescibacteria group bacterium]